MGCFVVVTPPAVVRAAASTQTMPPVSTAVATQTAKPAAQASTSTPAPTLLRDGTFRDVPAAAAPLPAPSSMHRSSIPDAVAIAVARGIVAPPVLPKPAVAAAAPAYKPHFDVDGIIDKRQKSDEELAAVELQLRGVFYAPNPLASPLGSATAITSSKSCGVAADTALIIQCKHNALLIAAGVAARTGLTLALDPHVLWNCLLAAFFHRKQSLNPDAASSLSNRIDNAARIRRRVRAVQSLAMSWHAIIAEFGDSDKMYGHPAFEHPAFASTWRPLQKVNPRETLHANLTKLMGAVASDIQFQVRNKPAQADAKPAEPLLTPIISDMPSVPLYGITRVRKLGDASQWESFAEAVGMLRAMTTGLHDLFTWMQAVEVVVAGMIKHTCRREVDVRSELLGGQDIGITVTPELKKQAETQASERIACDTAFWRAMCNVGADGKLAGWLALFAGATDASAPFETCAPAYLTADIKDQTTCIAQVCAGAWQVRIENGCVEPELQWVLNQ